MKHILIVEDEQPIVKAIRIALEEQPVKVSAALDGEEAMKILEEETPDLIVLDVLMPRADGYAVLDFLKETEKSSKVLILTNLSSEYDQQKCESYGVCEYVVKSDISHDEIWEKISKYLDS